MQRPKFACAHDGLLRIARLSKDNFRPVIDERVELGIETLDALKVSARHLYRRNFFAADLRRDFQHREQLRS